MTFTTFTKKILYDIILARGADSSNAPKKFLVFRKKILCGKNFYAIIMQSKRKEIWDQGRVK